MLEIQKCLKLKKMLPLIEYSLLCIVFCVEIQNFMLVLRVVHKLATGEIMRVATTSHAFMI